MSQPDQTPNGEITHQPESIGKKIARLRQSQGWTQQSLSERLAISRVAVSHIEMDLTVPGERTVTLLAGLFKMTPASLVLETTYPEAKMERLPLTTCCYTPLELDLALMENDLGWLESLAAESPQGIESIQFKVWGKWRRRLEAWQRDCLERRELEQISAAQQKLRSACMNPD